MSDGDRGERGASRRQLTKIVVAFALLFALGVLGQNRPEQQHAAAHEEAAVQEMVSEAGGGTTAQAVESAQDKQRAQQPGVGWGTWPDWAIVLFTLALTILGALQYWLDRRTARDTGDSIEIARRAAEASVRAAEAANAQIAIAQKAYWIENRPWVGITSEEAVKLTMLADGTATLKLILSLRNTGRSPAHAVSVHARLIPEDRAEQTAAGIQILFERGQRERDEDAVTYLLPGQKWDYEFNVVCPREAILAIPETMTGRLFLLTVAGFVTYASDSLEDGRVHASSFIYRVAKSEDRRIRWSGTADYVDGQFLQIKRWPQGWQAD